MKIKVLVADDEADVLAVMVKKIVAAGYDVVSAVDGREAWAKIVSESPDVVLLDLTMPYMDGYEVLKKLRESPPAKKWQPVIIVSALNEMENLKKGFSLEADHYITKPCNVETILNAIKIMVSLIPQRKLEYD